MKDANMDYSGLTKQVMRNSGIIRVSSIAHKFLKSRSGPGAGGITDNTSICKALNYGKIGFDKLHLPKEKNIFRNIKDNDLESPEPTDRLI